MKRVALTALFTLTAATPAFAHLDPGTHGSFLAGFSHPLFGPDHILAMIGVGLWAALLGGRALWAVPGAFVATMVAGFALGWAGVGMPFVEPAIAASVVVLGLLVLVALQVPTPVGMALAGFFALFHGHAHGGELGDAGAVSFVAGFVLATALLHVFGAGLAISLGRFADGGMGRQAARALGGLAALGGLWLAAVN